MLKRFFLSGLTFCAALIFILFAFITGTHESFFWGAISFVSFFTVGVVLFHHGLRIWKDKK